MDDIVTLWVPNTYSTALYFKAGICVLRLGFEPKGWDLSLEAGILAWRLRFEPQGWDLSFKAGI